ncbi:hypothetical protein A3I56_01690 [Candidatus Roizmanbacteria bacterium RIFCSPLOWO2_02_FULL_43_10]|uniref:Transposase IS200-like domain-containing protein n=3 Tax=Candidatus Roizmaniibacteriota TaxID=1752723 RepID=A0A1F7JTZ1_9BACT|nr:MAG: hypothetical protein A3D08_00795 [Candidatus Roizmanbacteria bacterium RIFCSPHIGHO2_02_FULL_43_11]OGK38536.1 MAG: hypothetical protein A3F32_01835 [Candidatus Roizmanbacteria bacterium RIFCSPHIGHO2_12_FULL_42_10]OGK59052.1 MAG: hypothetical protein A3I56_01690 [Candidatus Roizmanbacteria bacterium RIFCSPLOWO2_02_FULL_43_10]
MNYCRRKQYIDNFGYHIYNRGVAKGRIFLSSEEKQTYISYLEEYLIPKQQLLEKCVSECTGRVKQAQKIHNLSRLKNYSKRISLSVYCLMPNHVHLIVHQKDSRDITEFMSSLHSRYARYFNNQYKRVGPLFQDRYSAVPIRTIEHLARVSRYVHRNPADLGCNIEKYKWSSLQLYKSGQAPPWLKVGIVQSAFQKSKYGRSYGNYMDFVNDDGR